MCTLVLFFQVFPDFPLVIAANRDEMLARPSSEPVKLLSSPWAFGGQDLLAGGTWLGVNAAGVAVGVLNRQAQALANAHARSRGQLCLDALRHQTAEMAVSLLSQDPHQYNPFNLVVADEHSAYVIDNHANQRTVRQLSAGIHIVTNRDANDHACSRIARFSPLFANDVATAAEKTGSPPVLSQLFSQLHQRMATHAQGAEEARDGLCIHLDGYGTRSSTLLAYARRERGFHYHFAAGPPCRTAYKKVSLPSPTLASHPPSTE
jgi:uncharacterized protein with NRDE domain